MGDIYRGATLTLAALHASSSEEGMFKNRNPLCFRRLAIPGTDFEISNTANWVIWEFDGLIAPLNTRAWVVQERLLAIRTLFFGATGLFWECAERQTPESALHPNAELWYNPDTNLKKMMSDALHGSATIHDIAKCWSEIRRIYTSCYLTYASDRSIAYLGLTNTLARATGFNTFCGIRVDICPVDLCWKIPYTDSVVRGPGSTEPSWSWLSVQSDVKPIPVRPILNFDKYYVVWSKLAKLIAKIELVVEPADGKDVVEEREELDIIKRPSNLQIAISLAPPGSLCFLTWFSTVYLLPDNYLTLKISDDMGFGIEATKPVSIVPPREESALGMETSSTAEQHARSAEDCAYKWCPDGVVDPCLKKASFINLARFESWDGKREGEAGLIAIEKDRRMFQRIGVFKKWVFKEESMCNYARPGGGNDPRYLPPNPFRWVESVKRFVILI